MGLLENLEGFSPLVQVKLEVLLSDVKDLAWYWESMFDESNQYNSMDILHGLVHAYLRGRGFRMGNVQGFRRHSYKLAMMCTLVTQYVIEEGPILFSALHGYGYDSPEKALQTMQKELSGRKDVLTVAEEILREKQ